MLFQSVTTCFLLFAFSLWQPVFMLNSVQARICAAAVLETVSVDFSNSLLICNNLVDNRWQPVLTAQALFLFHTLPLDHYWLPMPVTQSLDRMTYKCDRSWPSHLGTKNNDKFAENKACSSCSTGQSSASSHMQPPHGVSVWVCSNKLTWNRVQQDSFWARTCLVQVKDGGSLTHEYNRQHGGEQHHMQFNIYMFINIKI